MPTVPSYGERQVRDRPINQQDFTARASPEAFGAAIGRGMETFGAGLSQVAQNIQEASDLASATRLRERDTANADKLRTLKYDPDNGFLNKLGQNAVDGQKDYQEQVDKIFADGAIGLQGRELVTYNRMRQARRDEALSDGIMHVGAQKKAVTTDTFRARTESFVADAVAKYGSPADVERNIASAKLEVQQLGKLQGWSSERLGEEQRKLDEDARGQVFKRSAAYFDENLNSLRHGVFEDPASQDAAVSSFERAIDASAIPLEAKETMKREGARQIRLASAAREFQDDPNALRRKLGIANETNSGASIVDAMIHVESAGKADAISPKGAAGLMQVMPATGGDIARELGDTSFPMKGTDAEKRAYLSQPEVSKRYGTHYFAGLLDKYHGDEAAALIAYNGGSKSADAWLASGRDDAAIPPESAGYYRKVLGFVGSAVAKGAPAMHSHLQVAEALVGATAGKDFDAISRFIERSAGVKIDPRQTAWCAYFLNGVFQSQGIQGTGSGMARSFLKFGTAVEEPEVGDVVVFSRGADPSKGHVGIVAGINSNGSLEVLGGNQGKAVSISTYSRDNVLGFRRPPDAGDGEKAGAMLSTLPGGGPKEGLTVMPLDPRYAKLPFDDRMKLAQQAQQEASERETKRRAEEKRRYDEYKGSVELGIVTGKVSEADILGSELHDDDKASLIRTQRSTENEASRLRADVQSYASGGMSGLNALDPDDTRRADKVFKVLDDALAGQPAEVREAEARRFIKTTGIIPKSVEATIRGGALSEKPSEFTRAMTQAAQIENDAPLAFRNLPQEFRTDYAEYKHQTADLGLAGDAVAARMIAQRTDGKNTEQIYGKTADKFVKDYVKASDALWSFGTWYGRTPGDGALPREENQFAAEYQELAREEFINARGNMTVAKARAVERMKDTWGVSYVSGHGEVAKYPPEQSYPERNGSHDYIRADAIETAKGATGANVENVFLVADGATARDIDAKRPPSYLLLYTTPEDGPDSPHMAPVRWAIPIEHLQTMRAGDEEARRAAALQAFGAADADVTAMRQSTAGFDITNGPGFAASLSGQIAPMQEGR